MTTLIKSGQYDILRNLTVEAHRQTIEIRWAIAVGLNDNETIRMLDNLTELLEFIMIKRNTA